MKHPNIKQIMSKVRSFPGMPATAGKLLPLLKNPDSDASKIEDILRYDPGLTANILKLTNSAYFGIPAKISSVRQAIMLLGWKRLFQLVMTMCMSDLMKDSIAGYDLPKGELWRHSIAVSIAADVLVKSLQISEAEEVFTAALLHDIGKLVLGDYVQEDIPKIDAMVEKGISFEVAEYIVLGTDHAEIGSNILKNWSFPTPLVEAVHWHHDPNSCTGHCLMSDIVHIADILGQMAGYGKKSEDREPFPISGVLERLGLHPEDLEFLAEQTSERVSDIDEALG